MNQKEIILKSFADKISDRLHILGQFSDDEGPGVTRLPFTDAASGCIHYLKREMSHSGLAVRIDESGGVSGRIEGKKQEYFITGSHYDSVENGGAFDGIAGVVCGLTAAEYLLQEYGPPKYGLEVLATNDEEGARFSTGFFTIKAIFEHWTIEEMKSAEDKNGITTYAAMKKAGFIPEKLESVKRDISKIKGFLELHIEQGPVLEHSGKAVGIVDTIVGMKRMLIHVYGEAGHAGTTPMNFRDDALSKAAKVIAKISDIAKEYEHTVATVGYITAIPNAINTIAREAVFSLDIRSAKEENIISVLEEVKIILNETTERYKIVSTLDVKPTVMDVGIEKLMEDTCRENGVSFMHLNSGACHDSIIAGKYVPTAMLFVPSIGGRSHCPGEYSSPTDMAKATLILAESLKKCIY